MKWKRHIKTTAVLLLCGAVINLLVAMALAVWFHPPRGQSLVLVSGEHTWDPASAPDSWPAPGIDDRGWETSYFFDSRWRTGIDVNVVGLMRHNENVARMTGFSIPEVQLADVSAGWPFRSVKARAFPNPNRRQFPREWRWQNGVVAPAWLRAQEVVITHYGEYSEFDETLPAVAPFGLQWRGAVGGSFFYAAAIFVIASLVRWGRWRIRRLKTTWRARSISRPRLIFAAVVLLGVGAVLNVLLAASLALWAPVGEHRILANWRGSGAQSSREVTNWLDSVEKNADERRVVAIDFPGVGADLLIVEMRTDGESEVNVYPTDTIHQRILVKSGWPFPTLECTATLDRLQPAALELAAIDGGVVSPTWLRPRSVESEFMSLITDVGPLSSRLIPLRVRGPGFIAGSIFWTITLLAVRDGWFALVRRRRRSRGQCEGCGYRVEALTVCPECGMNVAKAAHPA